MPSRPEEHIRMPATPVFNATPVRIWATVDALVTGPLLIPASALWLVDTLYQLNQLLDDQIPMPEFNGLQLFFVCLAGALGALWAMVRLLWPQPQLSLADSLGRLWVAGLISLFVIGHGLPDILWVFVLTELSGALHQGWNLLRHDSEQRRASV
jgi:hypothetical protein